MTGNQAGVVFHNSNILKTTKQKKKKKKTENGELLHYRDRWDHPLLLGLKLEIVEEHGNGGIGTKCAENPTRKKCAKIPRSNISGMCGMSRSNPKVKYFRNVWNVRNQE